MSASESTQHSPSKNFTLEMSDKRKKQQTREGKQKRKHYLHNFLNVNFCWRSLRKGLVL